MGFSSQICTGLSLIIIKLKVVTYNLFQYIYHNKVKPAFIYDFCMQQFIP